MIDTGHAGMLAASLFFVYLHVKTSCHGRAIYVLAYYEHEEDCTMHEMINGSIPIDGELEDKHETQQDEISIGREPLFRYDAGPLDEAKMLKKKKNQRTRGYVVAEDNVLL
jgi:hypothetical protein